MTEVSQFVDTTIASYKIVVFSKPGCPYCAKTKEYFAEEFPSEKVHVVEIAGRPDMRSIQDYLNTKTGASTVPRTFINGSSIGGWSDLSGLGKEKVTTLIAASS